MGDPRRLKSKYKGPVHPWQAARIEEEKVLLKEYGLKNKKELWKTNSKLKNFAAQAKKLIAARGPQAELEKKQLLQKLAKLGLVKQGAGLDDVLGITIKSLLERRLQTIVCRQKFARTMKQARQFVTHEHVFIGGKLVSNPSYLVPVEDEKTILFATTSSLSNPEHPERAQKEKAPAKAPAKTPAKTRRTPVRVKK